MVQRLSIINPRKLFLADSVGALVSALMLGMVLVKFENVFGVPQKTLYALSFTACIFSIYSFVCFLANMKNWKPYLKFIAIVNLLYCFITLALIIYLCKTLTVLGLTYFVLEIILITILAIIELKTASYTNY